ncbi:MAG TPA: hypothetical protein VLM79_24845, partial [Kofleriaceae bacterium]|nr:hypothetical protein [Kofleriaceae bacterium]
MTAAASTAPGAEKTQALETSARELAVSHRTSERPTGAHTRLRPNELARALEHARRHLATTPPGDAAVPRAAEWFLDNYYLIRRVARQIKEDLPRGFARHLPWIPASAGDFRPLQGDFRIWLLARALIAATRLELDPATLRRFVAAYQEQTPLTIAELWALPTMLRTTVLRHLVRFLDELKIPVGPVGDGDHVRTPDNDALGLDPGVGVEYAIRALRLLDVVDWKAFFAKANRVEAILASDPAGVYARMDFATCDSYRQVVEALAWRTGRAEHDVADLAIALAQAGQVDAPSDQGDGDDRARHVGHYLVGDGRALLEERLGYRPIGLARVRRTLTRRPTPSYLLPLAVLTAVPLVVLGGVLAHRAPVGLVIAAIAIAAVPVSGVAVAICQEIFARLLSPRTLPKLDFSKGLTAEVRTLVAIPTLLGRPEDVAEMSRQLELHYLSNPDPELQFALLTDDIDSKEVPTDATLLELAARAIDALNARHGAGGTGPFHLLHREARWNPGEQRYMGWERKRGKLEELNRLLRGDQTTSYARHVGDPTGLTGIRFVVTLDSDTQLPIGTAQRLIGTLAHPLNRARTDPRTGRVTSGYTIVQPRVETSPISARRTH